MPFQTDPAWAPAAYRRAYEAWAANAPATDGPIMPRDAQTASPRHGKLSEKLRGLLTWKAATNPEPALTTSWMRYDLKPDNDNFDDEEFEPTPLDCEIEIRPSIEELRKEWTGPKEDPIPYSRGVAVGGNMAHGEQEGVPEYVASEVDGKRAPRRNRRIVTRIGRLEFSNGRQIEKCTVKKFGQPVSGEARMPAGALVRYKGWKPEDKFREAKGALPDTAEPTVGIGGHNPGVSPFSDPVIEVEWGRSIRKMVGEDTARILDLAIRASNFGEIGEAEGKQGKHAERHGKKMVLAACQRLDEVLAANDNFPAASAVAA